MRRLCFLLVAVAVLAGCGRHQVAEEVTTSVERVPAHPAELYVVTRSPAGESSVSVSLSSSHKADTTVEKSEGRTMTISQWETVESTFDFEVRDDQRCVLTPTFLERREGADVWRMDLEYTTNQEVGLAKVSASTETSETVAFDGTNPVSVMEDDHHSITVRPPNYHAEPGASADP